MNAPQCPEMPGAWQPSSTNTDGTAAEQGTGPGPAGAQGFE